MEIVDLNEEKTERPCVASASKEFAIQFRIKVSFHGKPCEGIVTFCMLRGRLGYLLEQPFQLENEDPQKTNVLVLEIKSRSTEQLKHSVNIAAHQDRDRDHGLIRDRIHGLPDLLGTRLFDPDGESVLYGPFNEDIATAELMGKGVCETINEPGVVGFLFFIVQVEDRLVKACELPREIDNHLQG